jgi:glucuronosyltransferase
MSQQVRVLLVNGERFLDFPRPLPTGITFMGEVGKKAYAKELPQDLRGIVDRAKKGFVIFSLGTVSNTTNMPPQMISSFVQAFGRLPDYEVG